MSSSLVSRPTVAETLKMKKRSRLVSATRRASALQTLGSGVGIPREFVIEPVTPMLDTNPCPKSPLT